MSYLLDTNVVSELTRPEPDIRVVKWFDDTPDSALYLSVLTLGELCKSVEKKAPGKRKEMLRLWLENTLMEWFEDRLLPVSAAIADHWGRLLADTARPFPAIDSLLAATALYHNLRLVTRNRRDFEFDELIVINPWEN